VRKRNGARSCVESGRSKAAVCMTLHARHDR
jgi:hypothetical protein